MRCAPTTGAGWTPTACYGPTARTTPGGASAAPPGPRTWAGGSTTSSPAPRCATGSATAPSIRPRSYPTMPPTWWTTPHERTGSPHGRDAQPGGPQGPGDAAARVFLGHPDLPGRQHARLLDARE